jgi:Flp pilus assembly protein TadB
MNLPPPSADFWYSTAIAVVFFIAGLVAAAIINLNTPRFAEFFQRRKAAKTEQARNEALRSFRIVKSLKDRKPHSYPYLIFISTAATFFATMSGSLFVILTIVGFDALAPVVILLVGLGLVTALLAIGVLAAIYQIAKHLEDFDSYKNSFEQKWGPIGPEDNSQSK